MKTYTWNAEDYKKNSQAQQKWALELLAKLKPEGAERILDIGCGDGKVTAEIAHSVPLGFVVGVDNSSPMVGLAKSLFPPTESPNLSFRLMDASDLAFKEEFDIVFSNAALHWIKDHAPVVAGIHRSLKPGGRILLQMGGKGNAKDVVSVLEDLLLRKKWRRYFDAFEFPYGFFGPDEYDKLLSSADFSVKRIELLPKDMVHADKAGLEGWLRTTWLPYTERIPQEERDEFIGEISSLYLEKRPPDPDGKVHVAMARLEVEAEKPR